MGRLTAAWGRELAGAAAAAIGQLALLVAGSVLFAFTRADYDPGEGGAFGIVVVLVAGPVVLLLLGLLHAALFALPVSVAARALGRRTPVPAAGWAAALGAVLAAVYAAEGWRHGLPYGPTWEWVAGLGVLPVAGALYARWCEVRTLKVVEGVAWVMGTGLLVVVAAGVGLVSGGGAPPNG
ncbi:hypothetical protein AB0F18_18980 [Streptomyces sp. NPDC029216]|uniref:hypothetical protein n=1 Tax=Streptomyces sp. NPDC029216 TaxID=3154701 RepID=UPI0033D2AF36